jgi:hypothetical protein
VTHTSAPLLALAPGHAPGTGANNEHAYATTGYAPPGRVRIRLRPRQLRLARAPVHRDPPRHRDRSRTARIRALPRLLGPPDAYDAWLSHARQAAACPRPVLLRGTVTRVDPATGEVTSAIHTDDLPDRAIHKPCGNRRATTCPRCAETCRRDAFQLIRAGLAGGKGIPSLSPPIRSCSRQDQRHDGDLHRGTLGRHPRRTPQAR